MRLLNPRVVKSNVRKYSFENLPVNIDLVTHIEKSTAKVGDDGYWMVNQPIIIFHFEKSRVAWRFDEGGETQRDSEHDWLLKELDPN
jgi:hypothetical protein